MATINEIMQKYGYKQGTGTLLGYEDYRNYLNAEYEEANREKNNGGFFGGLGYFFEQLGLGALGVIEGVWDFTAGGLADLFGADEWAEEQFANDWVNYNHANEWYNPSDGMKVVGDVASGLGNTLVGVGVGLATGGSDWAIMGTVGLGAAGNATKEAYNRTGELGWKEYGYGVLSGANEVALEKLTGGTERIVGSLTKNTAKNVVKKSVIKGIGKEFVSEAFEEGMSEFLNPYYLRWTQVDPNAENATWQQVGYSALVGGLSGALSGGIGKGLSAIGSVRRGNSIAKSPEQVESTVGMARSFAQYESENNTGIPAYQEITGLVNQFDALDKGDGTLTGKQKKLLGDMERANIVLSYAPAVQRSKENIVANAQQFIDAVNAKGLTDGATGKPIHIDSVEALVKNDTLLTQFAVADALGQILMSKDSVYDLVANQGRTDGIMQADFRKFQKEATAQQKASVNELFGIDVDSITYEDFVNTIQSTNRDVFAGRQTAIQTRRQAKTAISQAMNTNADVATIDGNTVYAEGMSVFKTKDGKYLSVSKQGDKYYLYMDGNISQPLSKAKLKSVVKALNGEKTTTRKKKPATTQATQTQQQAQSTPPADTTAEAGTTTAPQTTGTTSQTAENQTQVNNSGEQSTATPTDADSQNNGVVEANAEQTQTSTTEETSQATETTEETATQPKAPNKPNAPKASKAPAKATARRGVVRLVMRKDIRESLQGAAIKDGKQYVSDGFFVARYTDILEGVTEVPAENYPFEVFDRVISEHADATAEERVEVDADKIRGLVPTKRAEYPQTIMKVGKNYYQLHYFSKILDSISNPQVFLKKKGQYNPVYFKGDNGEAVLLPIRINSGKIKTVYEADYAVQESTQTTTPKKGATTAKKSTKKTTTTPKTEEKTETATKPKKEKTINGKTYKDFTVEEFKALTPSLRGYYLAKNKSPNAIVVAELGDFYEVFFDDAKAVANEFELTLTGRAVNGYADRIPMVGFPVAKFAEYKGKLNAKGLDVIKVDKDGKKVLYSAKTDTAAETKPKMTKKTTKTEDFGDKIGGARKDTWQKRGLFARDLSAMNRRELQQHVKKENVWKRPDFVKAIAEGGDRATLYIQNELYKSINATPFVRRSVATDTKSNAFQEAMEKYVTEIREVQEIAESIKTKEDFGKITKWLIEKGYLTDSGSTYRPYSWTEAYYDSPALYGSKIFETARTLERGFDSLNETALMQGFGVDKADKLPNGYTIRRVVSYFGGAPKYVIVKGGKNGRYASPDFSSYEEALAYGKEKFGTAETATVSTDGKKQRYVPAQLKDVHRNGLDYRKGKNAVGEDFLSDFGIKGGEFGNWLSENDRTTSLNYGYDAFCDLADALGIELTDISLNGTLSIGFGSRGKGLSGAAAHYEPARKVINLTKMNGAGSLAHEFWHAVEDYVSGDTHQHEMASDFSKMPERTREAGRALLNAINYKDKVVEIEELNENRAKALERNLRHLERSLDYEFKIFADGMTAEDRAKEAKMYRYKRTPTDADIARFKELREQAIKGESGIYTKFLAGERTIVDELNALLKEVKGRGMDKDTRQALVSRIEQAASYSEQAVETQTKRVKTQFHEDAIAISRTYAKDGGYWDSNCEMLARAFASYIYTKTDGKNDYLSGHALGAAPVVDKNGDMKIAYIYPHDTAEAEAIYKAFDEFFAAAKADGLFHEATRERPTTNVQYAMSEDTQLNTTPNGSQGQILKPLQMKRAETVARNNIKGFDNLTEAEKLEVEWTLASAWSAGKDTAEALNLARLSTAIGAGVGFANLSTKTADGRTVTPDAACYTRGGHLTIYLNPNGKRTVESATLHELAHSLEGMEGYAELQAMAEKYYAEHPAEKKAIDDMYREVYKNEQVKYAEEILPSELTAHYVETMLAKRDMLAKLTKEKPTFVQKCIEKIKALRKVLTKADRGADLSEVAMLETRFTSIFNLNKGKIGRGNQTTATTIKYASMNNKPFAENVRAVETMADLTAIKNDREASFVSVMKETPEVITSNVAEAENLEIIIRFDALYLATRQNGVVKGHYHSLGSEIVSKLPDYISNPDVILRLPNGRLNLLSHLPTEHQGLISIELNTVKDINSKNTKYNLVVSMFSPKDNYTNNLINKQGTEILYKKESLSQVNPQLYKWLATINDRLSTNSISETSENVNPETPQTRKKFALPAQDSQGATLTEQQREYFADTKAVDKHGNLLVMYHGTPYGKFYKFKGRDLYFFSTEERFARDYADEKAFANGLDSESRILETYLNVEKPFDINDVDCEKYLRKAIDGKISFGFGGTHYDVDTYISLLKGEYLLTPKWTKEQIKNATFGKAIGKANTGYNNDVFVGVDTDNNVVFVDNVDGRYLRFINDEQKSQLLQGKAVDVTYYTAIFGEYMAKYPNGLSVEQFNSTDLDERSKWLNFDKKTHRITPQKTTQESELLTGQDNWAYFELSTIEGKKNTSMSVIDVILSGGYDGIRMTEKGVENFAVRESNQIKLTDNGEPTINEDIRYALSPDDIAGSDRTMTELPDERITFRDVITRKKKVGDLTSQIKGDSKNFTEGWQIATTNAQAGLERVLRETGTAEATAVTNYVRAGKNAAYGALTVGQFSLDGETYLGESWQKIWSPVYAMDKKDGQAYKMFNLYLLHWHNTDRYAVGKPVFGDDVTVDDSIAAIEQIEREYPKFRKIAEKVWKFNDNNLQMAVDSGMYSAEYAESLREMYPHYVPTLRAEHRTPLSTIQGKNNVRVNPNNRRAVGSDLDILPVDETVAQQTIQRLASARVNQMLLSIKNGTAHDEFKVIGTESETADIDSDNLVTTFADKAKGTHQVTFWENGKSVTVEVSQNVYRGIEAFMPSGDTTFNNAIINAVAKGNTLFKKLVTAWNPFFVFFKNPIRDLQTALNYTRYSWATYSKNFKRATSEISNNGRYWQEAQAAGILSATVYDYRKGLQYKNKGKWSVLVGKLESMSNAIEMAPRLAEYISARESGLSVQEALLQAQDLTTNFGRSGTLTKKANATFMPFLNPAVQGFSKMVRAYTGKDAARSWINLIIRSLILGVGLTALNDLLNEDDEDYENLSDYVKNSNYVLALGDGQFLKIPKGRETGFIGELYLRAKRSANGDEDAWEGTFESFVSNLTPTDNFTRTIFSPFVDISTNSTWYGGTIEGQKWSDTEPKNRYDESTSSISIWLGQIFNYSPIKIDYLLEQYGGIVADVLLPATNLEAETGVVSQNMLVNSTTNSRWSTEFYSQIEKYTYKKTAGDMQAKGVVKYLNSISSTVSEMYKQKREIQADKDLSNDEKLTQAKIVQAAINALQKDSLSNAKILYEELGKYDLSEDNFDMSYLYAVGSVVGEEYALKTYNKQVYEKAQKLNTLGVDYGTYFDYYFAVKAITSDKDENGNTISGSKKASVIAYTMAQDIPNVQKLILILSAGYTIKDGDISGMTAKNAKSLVAKYITNLKITKEEKTELAEMCGFTVKNGKIYTD